MIFIQRDVQMSGVSFYVQKSDMECIRNRSEKMVEYEQHWKYEQHGQEIFCDKTERSKVYYDQNIRCGVCLR